MLSNSDTAIIRSLYAMPFFAIDEVQANRAINCKGTKRGKITELVITNYPVERAVQLGLLDQGLPYLRATQHSLAPAVTPLRFAGQVRS
jgi:DNA adenine methylase